MVGAHATEGSRLARDRLHRRQSRNEILDFEQFIPLWIAANEIAEDAVLPLLGESRHSRRRSKPGF